MSEIETRTATIFMDENNVLHMLIHKGVRIDYEDAVDNAIVINHLRKGKKVLKIVDARERFSIDKKAQNFITQVDFKQTIARAVIKNNLLSKLITVFFEKLSKPKIPTRIFIDSEEGYNWLLIQGIKTGSFSEIS